MIVHTALSKTPPPSMFQLVTDQWTEPFWEAARAHRLVAPRCSACGLHRFPPTPFCPRCQAQGLDWVSLSGVGKVYSYTIVVRAVIPEMEPHLPYVPAVIELPDAQGCRLISNIVDAPLEDIRVGCEVHVVWDHVREGVVVPRFALGARGFSKA